LACLTMFDQAPVAVPAMTVLPGASDGTI